jgi:hypothetical protein
VNQDRSSTYFDVLVFALLVSIGVAGRWGQPAWAFTPIAAATIFAGFYFSRAAIAVLVPVAILGISDLLLPAYDNVPVMLATYGVMTIPVWFGRSLRGGHGRWGAIGRWAVCGLIPATVFFFVSNFAVWAFQSDYEKSLAGLMQCYAAAVPFYRWMLAGDVFYLSVLASCWALSGMNVPQSKQMHAREVSQPRWQD